MKAIILAGGLGTRLSHIVKDVPKPMAPVNNRPFLDYILDYLEKNKIYEITIAVGYKKDVIMNHYGDKYSRINLSYSEENEPLGTGGAMKKAIGDSSENDYCVLNGDTFFYVDLEKMEKFHREKKSDITIATKKMYKFDRYGSILVNSNDDKIISIQEKKYTELGLISGGMYIINKSIFRNVDKERFSFEKDILENEGLNLNKYSFLSDGYFIDIGIPEDYYKTQKDFSNLQNVITNE